MAAEVRYSSARHDVEEVRPVQVTIPLDTGPLAFSLDRAELVELQIESLGAEPLPGASFGALPPEAAKAGNYDRWGKELVRWIQGALPITLYESKRSKAVSRPGESERDFRIRLADLGREARDREADRLREKYEGKFRTLEERLRRAEQSVEKQQSRSREAMMNTGLSAIGAILGAAGGGRGRRGSGGLLGAFLGSGASRAGTTMRRAGRAASTRQGIAHAAETVEAIQAHIEELEKEFQEELNEIEQGASPDEDLDEVIIRPALNAISTRLTALAWLPYGVDEAGSETPLW
jgi:hypothetical protein